MKRKWRLIASIIQLVFGGIAIVTFAVLGFGVPHVAKGVVTLVLAVAFVVLGIIGVIDHISKR